MPGTVTMPPRKRSAEDTALEEALRAHCGQRIRQEREARDWSLEDLRQQTGLSVPRLSALENGKGGTRLSNLAKIATAFHLPLAALLPPEKGSPFDALCARILELPPALQARFLAMPKQAWHALLDFIDSMTPPPTEC